MTEGFVSLSLLSLFKTNYLNIKSAAHPLCIPVFMAVRTMSCLKRFCCGLGILNLLAPPVTLMMSLGCSSFHSSISSVLSFFTTASFCSSVPSVGKPTRTYFAVCFEVFSKWSSPNAFVGISLVHSSFDCHNVLADRAASEWRPSSRASIMFPHLQIPL